MPAYSPLIRTEAQTALLRADHGRLPQVAVMKSLGVSRSTVQKWVRELGLQRRPGPAATPAPTPPTFARPAANRPYAGWRAPFPPTVESLPLLPSAGGDPLAPTINFAAFVAAQAGSVPAAV